MKDNALKLANNNPIAPRRYFLERTTACLGGLALLSVLPRVALGAVEGALPAITSILLDGSISVGTFSGTVPIPQRPAR